MTDISADRPREMRSAVALYQAADGSTELEVRFEGDTVWLTQQQLSSLFGRDVTVIRRHLANAQREELAGLSTSAKFALVRREGGRVVERNVEHYNLDAVLSVGYRVKSPEGIRFRRWATERLRDYLVKGYAINAQRLEQLGSIVQILARSSDELVAGVADVLSQFVPGLSLLRDYDDGHVEEVPGRQPAWELTLDEARSVIATVAAEFPGDDLFGRERGDALDGVIGAIYQGFGGQDVYSTVEQKAAHLLYFVVKDHPLSDGNKRSAAALFVTFLARNGALTDASGRPRITNNALAAITLMVAMSDPREKELMIALIIRMVSEAPA